MVPASGQLYDAIVHRRLVLPDDQVLATHAANAIARHGRRGWRNRQATIPTAHRRDHCPGHRHRRRHPPARARAAAGVAVKRRCLTCRALIDSGSYCSRCRPQHFGGSTRAWRTVRARVLARDRGRCVVCGAPAEDVDHILPREDGGSDDPRNLRSLCAAHHADMHRSPPIG
jgi:5-methylcytosine-specific restriction endonuclease McrA